MKKLFTISLFLLTTFFVAPVFSQEKSASCAELKKLIDKTYNFKPSKLTESEQTTKSAEMDVVWEKVKANQKELMPCLREAINSPAADRFFKFDASNLLIQLDQSDETKKTLIKSYSEVDLADVNLRYWMPYIAILGYQGFDTSAAGENWLKYPNPHYPLPEHGNLEINKEIGALIIYGSMDESLATPALAKIASIENHPARNIAVEILLQQVTPESFKELKKLNQKGLSETTRQKVNALLTKPNLLAAREGTPKVTRQQYLDAFQQLADGKPDAFIKLAIEVTDGEKDAIAVLKPEDIPLVRKARRAFTTAATPESAEWYKSFTDILLAMIWKPDLVNTEKSKKIE